MAWYIEAGPQENVVLSSRVRIARNLQELPFPNRLNPEQAAAVEKQIEGCFLSLYPSQSRADWNIVRLAELEDMQRLALAEKHLLSKRMLEPGCNKKLIISKDESQSMMILEEDHLRIQAMSAGLDLEQAYRLASDLTCKLEAKLPLAWDDQFGFLTACPTNTGTGLRASVMLFLPGLIRTDQLRYLTDILGKAGYAVRGSNGEGSKVEGYRVQISNQMTLGLAESEILQDLNHLVKDLIQKEQEARRQLQRADSTGLEDQVWRARGILENARRISFEEACGLLAELRLGIGLGIIEQLPLTALNRIDANIGPASLQQISGKPLSAAERDQVRARLIREELLGAERHSK
ncbi:MAG: ATP--guanido phosphotransferase [Saccharofermentanales bacterium]|jgi:protein arginine kinase